MNTIEIIIQTLIGVCLLYLIFFKSYFKEKGKNLATKEDIGEITEVIEHIKSNFQNETENIKQELQFINQKRITLLSEERNSILNYYEPYYRLFSQLMGISFSQIDRRGDAEVAQTENLIDTLKLEYNMALGRLELFFDNLDFQQAESELKKMTLNLEHHVYTGMIEIRTFVQYRKISESKPYSIQVLDELKKINKDQIETMNKFYAERLIIYSDLYPTLLKVRQILITRLETLLK